MIIRPSFTVLSGAAIGLVAGAAVYGAVSSSATPTLKPTKAVVAAAPAAVASCAKGQKLEDGVCVIHVVRTVVVPAVVPAPAAAQLLTTPRVLGATSNQGSGSSASGATAATQAAHDAEEVGHGADDATEAAEGAAEGTAPDVSADRAANDDSNVAAH
jgi:hypothetical protein